MYLIATDNFKPNDPSTHVKYDFRPGASILIIETPDKKFVPYNPKDHNDQSQKTGLRAGHTILHMAYTTFFSKFCTAKVIANQVEKASRNPTQEEIAILDSSGIDAYVAVGFDPNADVNEKYTPPKHDHQTKILVLKKKIFGGACEPYEPRRHGTNLNVYKSTSVSAYYSARGRARKLYDEWKNNNTVATSTQEIGAKLFNPIILMRDSELVPEIKEQESDSRLATSQTDGTSQQRKRTAEDSVSSSTPFFITRNVLTLFQDVDEPVVPKDPTEPKRFRPWES